jgi:hypothetical protein
MQIHGHGLANHWLLWLFLFIACTGCAFYYRASRRGSLSSSLFGVSAALGSIFFLMFFLSAIYNLALHAERLQIPRPSWKKPAPLRAAGNNEKTL